MSGLAGGTEITPKTWNHVVLVRDGRNVAVYLNGRLEMKGEASAATGSDLYFGGSSDGSGAFEGMIDEGAIYRRALKAEEIRNRYQTSGLSSRAH